MHILSAQESTPDVALPQYPVVAFEHLMYADDRAGYPMTFVMRWTFAGRLERDAFGAAIGKALRRHPLLSARMRGDAALPTQQLAWIVDANPDVPLDWDTDATPLPASFKAGIDLTRAIGIRLYMRESITQSVLTVQVHHAASDAIGLVRFIEDVLGFYNMGGMADPAQLAILEPSRLLARGDFQLSTVERRARRFRDLQRISLYFRKFPAPLASGQPKVATSSGPAIADASLTLDAAQIVGLKAGARLANATVNDVLLRDLFVTLDDWNKRHGGRRPVRLSMPINMRRLGDERIPAANIVSMGFLDRQGAQLDNGAKLLASVKNESSFIKSHFMGHAVIVVAAAMGLVKNGMKTLMTPRRPWLCSATAVLSNLGAPLAHTRLARNPLHQVLARGVPLVKIELFPPTRPYTAIAVGAVSYAGEVNITAHIDPTVLAQADASAIFERFKEALTQSLEAPLEVRAEMSQLLAKHAARRSGATAFRSLSIGKNVHVEAPLLPGHTPHEAYLPAASAAPTVPSAPSS